MATRTTQLGASANRRRSATGASGSSRARATSRSRSSASSTRDSRSTAKKAGTKRAANATRSATKATPRAASRGTTRDASARTAHRNYVLPLAIVAVLVIATWSFYPVARLQYSEEREAARLEAELEGLKERNADLRAQVDRLKTPEGVEEIARESLGMVKEGENLVVVVDGEEEEMAPVTDPDTATIPQPEPSTWQKVLDALFGFE